MATCFIWYFIQAGYGRVLDNMLILKKIVQSCQSSQICTSRKVDIWIIHLLAKMIRVTSFLKCFHKHAENISWKSRRPTAIVEKHCCLIRQEIIKILFTRLTYLHTL